MMSRPPQEDSTLPETVAKVRERIVGLEHRTNSNEQAINRETIALRAYVDNKLESNRQELRSYIDQRVMELTRVFQTNSSNDIDPRMWSIIVMVGLFSAGTFVSIIVWMVMNR